MKHVFVQTDFGTSKAVRRFDDVIIELVENGTTGYAWQISLQPPDAVELVDSEFVPPESDAAGAAGLRRFRLRPVRGGHVLVTLQLICPFRKADPPAASGTIELRTET